VRVYPDDDYVYWGFTAAGMEKLARRSGFTRSNALTRP